MAVEVCAVYVKSFRIFSNIVKLILIIQIVNGLSTFSNSTMWKFLDKSICKFERASSIVSNIWKERMKHGIFLRSPTHSDILIIYQIA